MSGSVWLRSGVVILGASASLAGFSPGNIATLHGIARVGGRGAVNAVVWLDAPNAPPTPAGKIVLDQRNLNFVPHVLAVRTGTIVDFPNNDRVFHNVFSFHDGKPFDLGIYPVGMLRHVKFDQTGLSRIFCNIHPGMSAYVMAVDTPYFAVSDEQGAFAVNSVPPGTYTYHAWRASGTALTGSIAVGAAAEAPLTIDWP